MRIYIYRSEIASWQMDFIGRVLLRFLSFQTYTCYGLYFNNWKMTWLHYCMVVDWNSGKGGNVQKDTKFNIRKSKNQYISNKNEININIVRVLCFFVQILAETAPYHFSKNLFWLFIHQKKKVRTCFFIEKESIRTKLRKQIELK